MGPESYRHRTNHDDEREAYGLTEHWYVDPHEVDHFCTMIEKGEISYPYLEHTCADLDYKLNILKLRPEMDRSAQDINLLKTLQESIERLKPYRKKLKEQRDSGEIDYTKEDNLPN